MDELHVVLAREEDANLVLEILNEATQYKNKHNDKSWGVEPWQTREILDSIEAGNRYLVFAGKDVVGCFVLDWTDKLWVDDSPNAAYVHQLAVKSNFHGLNIGSKMLDIATSLAKQNGKSLLRLDCNYDNKKLCNYYKKANFTLHNTRQSNNTNNTIALFQKIII
jgi:ribosomal protein S18 acetylase RimI-like enzyme